MFLIIETGDPVTPANRLYGSFAQWFIQGLELPPEQIVTVAVHHGQALPEINQAAEKLTGIIITGSAAMVTDREPWMLSTQHWLNRSFQYNIPTLGVCFGHQMLADILGGTVEFNQQGRHMGLSNFSLTAAAKTDQLFQPLAAQIDNQANTIPAFVSHLQIVTALPRTATLLGSTELDENHAFYAEKTIWGVQFHPEWTAEIMSTYIQARQSALVAEGFHPESMIQALKPCDAAYGLLKHFAQLST